MVWSNEQYKLALSTIIRDIRWSKQKTTKVLGDLFIKSSPRLDKEHLERSALTASQVKKRIDQSTDNVTIVRKGLSSREVSPLFKSEVESAAKNRDRAKALRTLLEANALWNATRRDTSANDLRRIVDETSTLNPGLRKELFYSWEYGFDWRQISRGRAKITQPIEKGWKPKEWKSTNKPIKNKV